MNNLTTALELIKYICEKETECEKCPMSSSSGECLIMYQSPENWIIKRKTYIKVMEE